MTEDKVKLQHEKAEQSASKVTVHYDGKIRNLEVNEDGTVEAENREQVKQLKENHGKFFPVNDEDVDNLPEHVLADKTVSEAEEYIQDIEEISRLKELRRKEDRTTAIEAIDSRIAEVKEQEEKVQDTEVVEEDAEEDNEEEKSDDESEENNQEDGEETEE